MNIDTRSWHYKLYQWTYAFFETTIPQKTNLCQYLRRITLMPLGIAVLMVLFAFTWILIQVMGLVILPFGRRTRLNLLDNTEWFVPYPGLKIGYWELYPWHVLLVVGLILMQWGAFHYHHYLFLGLEVAFLLIIAVVVGLSFFFSSEASRLLKTWWHARAQRLCPTVQFTNKPTSEE